MQKKKTEQPQVKKERNNVRRLTDKKGVELKHKKKQCQKCSLDQEASIRLSLAEVMVTCQISQN